MSVAVVGSGPSAAAAAVALVEAGQRVEIVDAGVEPEPASLALSAAVRERVDAGAPIGEALLSQLKRGPGGGAAPGLLRGLSTLLAGGVEAERVIKRIQGSSFAFDGIEQEIPLVGASIPRSLARGGLSNVWGASCYAMRDADYADWPLPAGALSSHYARAAEVLGLSQCEDGLAAAYPLHGPLDAERARNPASAAERLVAHWRERGPDLAGRGLAAGRTRLAVRPPGHGGEGCRTCGLCFYGCAFDVIYSARRTLDALAGRPGFGYRGGQLVLAFREEGSRVWLRARDRASGAVDERPYDAVFLGAGVLSSLRIVADSLGLHGRETPLLDNDMHLVPSLLLAGHVGGRFRSGFTLGEAVVAVEPGRVAERGLHLQLYSFHEYFLAELGDLLRRLPAPLQRAAWSGLNNLLLCFTYLAGHDSVIARARVERAEGDVGRIHVEQRPNPEAARILKRLFRELRAARRDLGFAPLSPLAKATPLGFSGHLSGSLPMRAEPGPLESGLDGRVHGTRSVYVVDTAAFPGLPAQNLTYTAMANALRVAAAFSERRRAGAATAPAAAAPAGPST